MSEIKLKALLDKVKQRRSEADDLEHRAVKLALLVSDGHEGHAAELLGWNKNRLKSALWDGRYLELGDYAAELRTKAGRPRGRRLGRKTPRQS